MYSSTCTNNPKRRLIHEYCSEFAELEDVVEDADVMTGLRPRECIENLVTTTEGGTVPVDIMMDGAVYGVTLSTTRTSALLNSIARRKTR